MLINDCIFSLRLLNNNEPLYHLVNRGHLALLPAELIPPRLEPLQSPFALPKILQNLGQQLPITYLQSLPHAFESLYLLIQICGLQLQGPDLGYISLPLLRSDLLLFDLCFQRLDLVLLALGFELILAFEVFLFGNREGEGFDFLVE